MVIQTVATLMVELKLRVGPKGQIVIPKFVRERLGIKPRGYVIVELEEGGLIIRRGLDTAGLLRWLRETRKPVASRVSRLGLEDEALEVVP